jgi:hypothetical protein
VLKELIGAWEMARGGIVIAQHMKAKGGFSEAHEAETVAWHHETLLGIHAEIHMLLGELTDDEREAIWPKMEADDRSEFDREHMEWLRTELHWLDSRMKFLHAAKAEMPEPSTELKADLAKAAEDWGNFVADCSRAEEHALGLDVRLRSGMKGQRL